MVDSAPTPVDPNDGGKKGKHSRFSPKLQELYDSGQGRIVTGQGAGFVTIVGVHAPPKDPPSKQDEKDAS